jgi:hypothetical protein
MWCLNDTHTYLERQLVNNVYCVIISNGVFAPTTNIKSLINIHDRYMHCIIYSNGHMITYTC